MAFKNLDFLNANMLRSFPIEEGATRLSNDGSFTIPDDLIADMLICSDSAMDERVYISKLTVLGDLITVVVSDGSGEIGQFEIDQSTHTTFNDYPLLPNQDNHPAATGRLTAGSLTGIQQQGTGVFEFSDTSTRLEMRVLIPALRSPTSVRFVDADGNIHAFDRNFTVVARNNLRFRFDEGTSTVYLDAGDGLGLNRSCDAPTYIQTINGQPPDANGNFTLLTADCASLTPLTGGGGLIWSDKCCKPCLACEEVNTLVERLMELETNVLTLRRRYNELHSMAVEFGTLLGYSCEC